MSITVVQEQFNWGTVTGAGGIVASSGIIPTAGNTLIVGVTAYNGDPADVGPSTVVGQGWDGGAVGSFTKAVTTGNFVGTNGHCLAELWWAPVNFTSGGFGEPRVTLPVNAWAVITFVIELSGTDAASPIGSTGQNAGDASGGGTSDLAVALGSAPASDSAVVGVCGCDYQFHGNVPGAPTGFTVSESKDIAPGNTHWGQGMSCYELSGAAQTNHFTFAGSAGNDLYAVTAEILVAPPPPPYRPSPIRRPAGAAVAVRQAASW